ncbi:FHA domain-containing protein [Saccharopolyspora sp. ASAGF58]|uniref:FHA domain-containing protein n=1 Tax=Saccharopolyspora sp. ASAGF58 TaxID=2719023 RepID=UPI001445D7A4|nr:FHA domain-containing protein [Saccharopolyspora sp. ASAGF58]
MLVISLPERSGWLVTSTGFASGDVMSHPANDVPPTKKVRRSPEATIPSTEPPKPVGIPQAAREPVSRGANPKLIYTRGPDAGVGHEVNSPCMLGRDHSCDLVLDDPTVSRFHAEVLLINDCYVVTDVGSLNGTYVNGRLIDRAELGDGDAVWIGTYRLRFQLDG